jgi:hypothetical protein
MIQYKVSKRLLDMYSLYKSGKIAECDLYDLYRVETESTRFTIRSFNAQIRISLPSISFARFLDIVADLHDVTYDIVVNVDEGPNTTYCDELGVEPVTSEWLNTLEVLSEIFNDDQLDGDYFIIPLSTFAVTPNTLVISGVINTTTKSVHPALQSLLDKGFIII